MKQLDTVDRQILQLLQDNAKYTIKEIATQLGMTTTPVYERIKRMEEGGYINAYVAVLNKSLLGLQWIVFCKINLLDHSPEATANFEQRVQSFIEVVDCYQTAEDFDYLLKLVFRTMEHYQEFMETQIHKLPNIKTIRSSLVMREVKCSTQLPFFKDE